MNFAFTEEQQELRRVARRFLENHASSAAIRRDMASASGWDAETWRVMAQELGLTALTAPEAFGGFGFTAIELAAVMEEMGRALLCAPYLSTVGLAIPALVESGNDALQARYLPAIAEGSLTATVAFPDPGGAAGIQVVAKRDGAAFRLNGQARRVLDGHTAGALVIPAEAPGDGTALFVLDGEAAGLERTPLPTMDQTRKLADLTFVDVEADPEALLVGPGNAGKVLARVLDLAAVALAAEQVGGAERCLDMAVEYAKVRVQFGRPIGSFQAIKHKAADMMLRVESARSAAYYAAWTAASAPEELPWAAAQAKAYCSEAFFHCAAESLQIHGGIGFTWESDLHFFFKRARASEGLLGSPAFHRERIARMALGLPS